MSSILEKRAGSLSFSRDTTHGIDAVEIESSGRGTG
jgi:hypothetical protein